VVDLFDHGGAGTENVHMKTATVRDLRNHFSKLEAWLLDGEDVCIEKRGERVAMLTAIKQRPAAPEVENPDFEARSQAIWGDRVFTEEEVRQMREYELEGEQG
jgi:antitoxin (DNA-binding transcriptional repressor) of toxin-antitoxin stability system